MAFSRSLLAAFFVAALTFAVFKFSTPTRAQGDIMALATPNFVTTGKRYAFPWAGGGPAQTYTVKQVRSDGWVLVEVADEATNPIHFVPGENPTRWLHVGLAISIQEMRPHQ